MTNLWIKFKTTVHGTLLNQKATSSQQVKVEIIQNYNYSKNAHYQQILIE